MSKRIAIIGAGWMGIGCLRILKEVGHQVDVYEKADDIGGVWHPHNCYAGLSLHGPATTVEYHDFPLPSHIDKTSSMTSEQIYLYMKSYCREKKLEENLHLNATVQVIHYDRKKNICTLEVIQKNASDGLHYRSVEYDYVVYTHGFTDRSIPHIRGQENFLGSVYHAFDLNEAVLKSIVAQHKKVTLVGAGKAATDLILAFSKYHYPLSWVYKTNYWFFRESVYRKALRQAVRGKKKKTYLYAFVHLLKRIFLKKNQRLYFFLLKFFRLIHTYGPPHSDFKKYHGGRIEDAQMSVLKNYNQKFHVMGEIDSYDPEGVQLKDGQRIQTDCVIFCTGSGGCRSLIPIQVDYQTFPLTEVRNLYRSRVIPEIPALIFTAFSDFNIGTVNGLIYGKWIEKFIANPLPQEDLSRQATSFNQPFFTSMHLFDSSEYFHVRQERMLTDFFKSGELSPAAIKKWSWAYHFGGQSLPPYDFQPLEKV